MGTPLPRRSVLGAAGIVSLGAVLAACTREAETPGTSLAGTEGTSVTTDAGNPATVQPSTTGIASSARTMLDDATSCTLAPETTEGPYYFDVDSIRGDIREDRQGVTMRTGVVELATIYRGWYRGRAVHVHFKVHLDQSTVLTSQLFFDEGFTDEIYDAEPYASQGERDTRIDTGDMVYDQADAEGTPVLLTLQRDGDEVLAATNIVVA